MIWAKTGWPISARQGAGSGLPWAWPVQKNRGGMALGLAKREMRSTRAVASLVLLAHRDEREEQKQGTTEAGDCRTGCSGGRGAGTCRSDDGWNGRIVPWGTGSGGWWSSMGGDAAAWCREEMALPANAMRERS